MSSRRYTQRAAAPDRGAAERLFRALTARAGVGHARRVLERACGATSVTGLPPDKWGRAASVLRTELQAVAVADRALALVKTRLDDAADAAMTRRARSLIRNNLEIFAEDAIADALARHEARTVADAVRSEARAKDVDERRERAKNYRARAAGLHVVDEDFTIPWLLAFRTIEMFDEAADAAPANVVIDEPASAPAVAFEIGGKIGTAIFAGDDGVRFRFDERDFAVPYDALFDGFQVARARPAWWQNAWRRTDEEGCMTDERGCTVTG